ncbi:DUF4365 domain-containing protein [Actinoplanes sp. LDG1-06]|uniref:DUF4365 domain-containing protein n=1 Tax=Paractinoplanes ovalisporus TaxID=2810368 RepID=A0ABS2ATT5_9ACTN|nr:DUF4365 domain-containing protein [Actinoplanes ovalisporus]MBM2623287.1 DUF4365 domain-containing protein [Actinoplanes ovalisporus]
MDGRLVDLGIVVGAQVKSGESFFAKEGRDDTGVGTGWWFRENDRAHFDAWLSHRLPHFIVLRNLDERVSYWAPITKQTVKYTRKGAKVFVPRANVVDAANAGRLLTAAAGTTVRASWEGSAWAGAILSPSHQLRHALIVPRLVAPHPNRGTDVKLTAAQVTAMLMQVRLRDVARPEEEAESYIPNLTALPPDAAWDWRFAAALLRYIKTGVPDVLSGLTSSDLPPYQQAAGTVAHAAGLLEDGRADEALALLTALLARDEMDLIDHAWVQLQYARTLSELGHRQQARDVALDLIGLGQLAPDDVTAAAIGGAAPNTLLAVSDWDAVEFGSTMSASDTTGSWWRHQVAGWGLSAQAERSFRAWTRDTGVTITMVDEAWQYLRSASLLAGMVGDQTAWRGTTRDLAEYLLTDREHGADPESVAVALTTMRLCGDYKGLALAVRRVVNDGHAAAAQAAALLTDPTNSTRTPARADLSMLIESGDLLPRDRAERLVEWTLRTFHDPEPYASRTRPTFMVRPLLVELLTALVGAVGENIHHQLADFILELPGLTDQYLAGRIAGLLRRLSPAVWTPDRARKAVDRAGSDDRQLAYSLFGAAATSLPSARDHLTNEARSGSLGAVAALSDVTAFDTDLVSSLITALTARLEAQLRDAVRGEYPLGGVDLGHALTVLNVHHPQHANWDPILQLLEVTRCGGHLVGALSVLAQRVADLPEDVAARLTPLAAAIADGPEPAPSLVDNSDPRPPARWLQATLERRAGGQWQRHLAYLLQADTHSRRIAALLAGGGDDQLSLGTLIVLAGDPEPQVRATAAGFIAEPPSTIASHEHFYRSSSQIPAYLWSEHWPRPRRNYRNCSHSMNCSS